MNRFLSPPWITLGALVAFGACTRPGESTKSRSPAEINSEIHRLYESYRKDFPSVNGITPEALAALRAAREVVLVDVREPEERAVSIIPGAITREEFEATKSQLGDRPVVAYCTIGYRSGEFVELLVKEGIPARNLEGSILAWVNAGQPVVDPSGAATKRVHTYGRQWALLPEGYKAVY